MVSTWNKIIISLTFCPNSNDFPHLSTWCIAWVLYTCCTHCALCTCGSLWVQCTCYTLLYALHVPDALSALHVLKSFVLCMCCTPWVLCTCCTICTLVCVFLFLYSSLPNKVANWPNFMSGRLRTWDHVAKFPCGSEILWTLRTHPKNVVQQVEVLSYCFIGQRQ